MRGHARAGSWTAPVVVFALLLTFVSSGTKADLAAAGDAFGRGDFERAEAEWRPLAERGIVEGEFGLGEIYEQGKGDYKQAELWYEKAAEKGSIEARYRLALITLAGNKETIPNPITAYKWAILASDPNNQWGQLADDMRILLETHLTAAEQAEGKKQADFWREKLNPRPKQQQAAIQAPPTVSPVFTPPIERGPGIEKGSVKCPGLPQGIPCTDKEILPPIPGQPPLPPPVWGPQVTAPPVPRPIELPSGGEIEEIIKRIDCASLTNKPGAQGKPVISGTVPDDGEKTKLIRIAGRIPAEIRPEIDVEIMPPPLCRSLLTVDSIRAAKLASDRIETKLASKSPDLRDGDPIQVEVKVGSYPVHVRLDYFQLDGQVFHMLPNQEQRSITLAAGSRRVFGTGQKGEAWYTAPPFGTEFITLLATPNPVDLGERPGSEDAGQYLRALDTALRRARPSDAQPNLFATILLRTKEK